MQREEALAWVYQALKDCRDRIEAESLTPATKKEAEFWTLVATELKLPGWVSVTERLPTEASAGPGGCVYIWSPKGGHGIRPWNELDGKDPLPTHWRTPPPGPEQP